MKKLKQFLKKYWWLVLIVAALGFYYYGGNEKIVGYSSSGYDYYDDYDYSYAESASTYDEYYYDDYALRSAPAGGGYEVVYDESYEQKIMKSGSLSLHMYDVRDAVDEITDYAKELEGAVTSSSISKYGNSYTGYMTIRVPADNFDEAVDALKEMSVYVDYEYIYADDITETYMDLEARLNNLEAEEAAYLDVMEQAYSVEDILEVTAALSNVRYEIESIESSLSYYDTRVNYSTIDLTLTEDDSITSVTETWKPISTVRQAFSDWVEFLQAGADKGIYAAIYLWPVVLFVLVVWLVKRRKK